LLRCASGQHIPHAWVYARKAGKTPQTFLKFQFKDLLVSSFQTDGSGTSDVIPLVQVSLNFTVLEVDYCPQKADGSLEPAVHAGWDLKQSVAA
jgi:type VI secretion system secreted protein Hcp